MTAHFLGPYSNAEMAFEATRVAIADLIKAGSEWPSHGNAPLAIAALVASQVTDIAALRLRCENAERDLRHWREEVGKLHSKTSRRGPDEARLRRAWELGRHAFTPAGILSDKARTERDWAEDYAKLSKAEGSS